MAPLLLDLLALRTNGNVARFEPLTLGPERIHLKYSMADTYGLGKYFTSVNFAKINVIEELCFYT